MDSDNGTAYISVKVQGLEVYTGEKGALMFGKGKPTSDLEELKKLKNRAKLANKMIQIDMDQTKPLRAIQVSSRFEDNSAPTLIEKTLFDQLQRCQQKSSSPEAAPNENASGSGA